VGRSAWLKGLDEWLAGVSAEDVLVAEIRGDSVDDRSGRLRVSTASLVPALAFDARMLELLNGGHSWINLSYAGVLPDGSHVVLVESSTGRPGPPPAPVNCSGPCRAVREAGGDVRAVLDLV
jgi:hypothetical protein